MRDGSISAFITGAIRQAHRTATPPARAQIAPEASRRAFTAS
jgi:hypothetical protein